MSLKRSKNALKCGGDEAWAKQLNVFAHILKGNFVLVCARRRRVFVAGVRACLCLPRRLSSTARVFTMKRRQKRVLQMAFLFTVALIFLPNVGLWSLYREKHLMKSPEAGEQRMPFVLGSNDYYFISIFYKSSFVMQELSTCFYWWYLASGWFLQTLQVL
ncbi:hypothetical protein NFI96_008951 [Prochilodus magdalenae]|nr:hypothetical protein NFI96_008951 [Prochilodus magdalenae]